MKRRWDLLARVTKDPVVRLGRQEEQHLKSALLMYVAWNKGV
jgi:positive regulator of sigma E activity